MRLALIGQGEEMDRIAGWLGDEGQIVRRFDEARALAEHGHSEHFDWVVCNADDVAASQRSIATRGWPATRCLLIDDALPTDPAPTMTVLLRPLRRRLLLETIRGAAAQVRDTK